LSVDVVSYVTGLQSSSTHLQEAQISKQMRTAPFWVITHRVLMITLDRSSLDFSC